MHRKQLLLGAAGLLGSLSASSSATFATSESAIPLQPPGHGPVQVAFAVGPDLVAIDFFGPLTAFAGAWLGPSMEMGKPPLFNTYSVAATKTPLDQGGFSIVPQYTFENAPQPHVLVVPMQRQLPETIAWIRKASAGTDVTMSVCTGAFLVAKAGLFNGHRATTHHDGYDLFAKLYPKVDLIRGPRFVESGMMASSGGESCGMDLALRVIERYYGLGAAKNSAYSMEYRCTPRPKGLNDVGLA
jgi:transcriptional regulator GlxA family with amidase domain